MTQSLSTENPARPRGRISPPLWQPSRSQLRVYSRQWGRNPQEREVAMSLIGAAELTAPVGLRGTRRLRLALQE